MVGLKVDEGEGARVKVRKIGAGGLKLKMRGGGKSAVQQVHENVLRRFKELVLVACLHKHLLGENVLHKLPGLRRDLFQVPVRIYADEAAKAHACADERRKTPPVGAIRQLDIVRPTGCEHRIFADDRTGLIGDLAAAHGGFKERIGKAERQIVRRDVEGVVQHQKRAAQKFARADGELSEIVLRKELFKQRFGAAHFPCCFAHAVYSSNLVLLAQQIFSLLYRQFLVFARGKDKLYSRTRKEGRKKKEDASVHGIPCAG